MQVPGWRGSRGRTRCCSPSLVPFEALTVSDVTVRRRVTLAEKLNEASGDPEMSLIEGLQWTAPATVRAKQGATEVWSIINLTGDWHPFHVHFVPAPAPEQAAL